MAVELILGQHSERLLTVTLAYSTAQHKVNPNPLKVCTCQKQAKLEVQLEAQHVFRFNCSVVCIPSRCRSERLLIEALAAAECNTGWGSRI